MVQKEQHDLAQPPRLDRYDALIAAGLGMVSLILYVRTLAPGLVPSDGAEFQTLAYTVDHAHTTGYEVYVLLAKLFTLLVPVSDIAYRVNLFSAVCGALTVAFVFLAGRVLSGSRWAGAIGAAALAISATFWSQAIIAEVYTAGSVFTSAILFLVLLWYQTDRARLLLIAGLLGGLSIGVHGSNSLFAPAIGLLVLLRWRKLPKTWKPALGGALLGLVLMVAAFAIVDSHETYASVLNAAYRPSISRWDMQVEDLSTFGGRFAFLVFARQWRSAMFTDPAKVMPSNLGRLLVTLPQDFAVPLLALALLGMVALFTCRWQLGLFFLVAILVHGIYTLNYRIGDIYVFYISLYVYLCALMAEGSAVLLRLADRLPKDMYRIAHPALAIVILILAALPFYHQRVDALEAGELRFPFMDLASNRELAQWRQEIETNVKALPPDAIVLMDWGHLYGYFYASQVEQNRPDLLFIEAYPYATKPGMADSLLTFIQQNLRAGKPVYTLTRIDELQRGGLRMTNQSVGATRMYLIQTR